MSELKFKDINLSYDNNDLKFPKLTLIKQKNEFSNKKIYEINLLGMLDTAEFHNFLIKEILMIGYGVNIRFMRLLVVIERLIGFGVLRKFFLQTNSIFCLRTLNQKEFLLKRFPGIGFRN